MGSEQPRRYERIIRTCTVANIILEILRSVPPLPRPEFEIASGIEAEDAERMVAHYRRKDQLSRPKEDLSGSEVGDRSLGSTLNALPGLYDFCIFGVPCRVR